VKYFVLVALATVTAFACIGLGVAFPDYQLFSGVLGPAGTLTSVVAISALVSGHHRSSYRREREERAARRRISPMTQTKALSEQYGLPFAEYPVSGYGMPAETREHICNHVYYFDVQFCPRHGKAPYNTGVLTPVKKPQPLPVIFGRIDAEVTVLRELLTEPDVPDPEEAGDEYVPEGYSDMQDFLRELVDGQARHATRTAYTGLRLRHWRVSPEWDDELKQAYPDRYKNKTLYGYPVVVSKAYGVPELYPG